LQNLEVDGMMTGIYEGYPAHDGLLYSLGGFDPSTATALNAFEDLSTKSAVSKLSGSGSAGRCCLTALPSQVELLTMLQQSTELHHYNGAQYLCRHGPVK